MARMMLSVSFFKFDVRGINDYFYGNDFIL